MKKGIRLRCLLLALALPLWGASASPRERLSFSGLDLSGDNRLLFRLESGGVQGAVFVSRLTDLALRQITAFPEKMDLVENGRTLLVRNRFGVVRLPVTGDLPRPVPGFPSFAAGNLPEGGRSGDLAASADGRWILYMEPSSPAFGDLILLEIASGGRRVVSRRVELPARDFPARWSPDSRRFVYAKGGRLFYYALGITPAPPVDERYRQIGEGGIASICWNRMGDFFYFRRNNLYLVRSPELATRTIYGDFLSIGDVAAKLPLDFDSNFDRFWLAPDSRSLLFAKAGRNIFFCPLDDPDSDSLLPYVVIPGGAPEISVLWPSGGQITIVASAMGNKIMAWRFDAVSRKAASFQTLTAAPAVQCALSPGGSSVLFWGKAGFEVWDYNQWEPALKQENGPVYSCVWLNNDEFIAGDARLIGRFNLSGQRELVCLSDADAYGFEEGGADARMTARSGNEWFVSDGKTPWTAAAEPRLRAVSQSSGRYRVFLEPQPSGPYENIPMIRNITSTGTATLLPLVRRPEDRRGGGGNRVALCFDLYDDDAGLCQVLDALDRFGVKATFFMNGDFIRRSAAAAAAIINAGHEAASLFYAPIDFSDFRYRVSPEYIAQGLARNEDEYYRATGKELSLLWHPPFYRTSPEVAAAAAKAGYRTAGRSVDPMDWISREDAQKLGLRQYSAPEMIELIMEAQSPGAVIPVRLGLLPGGRDDYLFLRIEVLLDALIRAGCELTPVSTLLSTAAN